MLVTASPDAGLPALDVADERAMTFSVAVDKALSVTVPDSFSRTCPTATGAVLLSEGAANDKTSGKVAFSAVMV